MHTPKPGRQVSFYRTSILETMKIALFSQLTGKHGPGATTTYGKVFAHMFPNSQIFIVNVAKDWADLSICNDLTSIAQRLESLDNTDIAVFLGFDWHSRAYHLNPLTSGVLSRAKALLIGICQESFASKRNSVGLIAEMNDAAQSSYRLLDLVLFNHYRDYESLSQSRVYGRNRQLKVAYLPFLNPFDEHRRCQSPSDAKQGKAVFVGRAEQYTATNPYFLRSKVLDQLEKSSSCDLIQPSAGEHISPQEYFLILSRYKFGFVAPSIDSSLTVRPIEACAAGAIPILPRPSFSVERQIFKDMHNCIYYEPLGSVSDQLDHFCQLDPAVLDLIYCNACNTSIELSPTGPWAEHLKDQITQSIIDHAKASDLKSSDLPELSTNHASQKIPEDAFMIAIDLVFFQFSNSGIARVWDELLYQLSLDEKVANTIILLVRENSNYYPRSLDKFQTLEIPSFSYDSYAQDSLLVDWACEQVNACLFVSTYFTYSASYPNVSMIHDCIPERVSKRALWENMWKAKEATINHSFAMLTISEHSAKEIHSFYPTTRSKPLFLAENSIRRVFVNADSSVEVPSHSKGKPFCLLVGERQGYLGYKNGSLALLAVSHLNTIYNQDVSVLVTGGWQSDSHPLAIHDIEESLYHPCEKLCITRSNLTDQELADAYRNAVCLLYLSEDEGFGLPLYECLAAGGFVVALDRVYLRDFSHPRLIKVTSAAADAIALAVKTLMGSLERPRLTSAEPQMVANTRLAGDNTQAQIVNEMLQLCQSYCVPNKSSGLLFSNVMSNRRGKTLDDILLSLIDNHPANWSAPIASERCDSDLAFITSTYNSSQYIHQLAADLDLVHHASRECSESVSSEWIVIDSCSPSNELEIIAEVSGKLGIPFTYYKTPFRESLYQAWNRGAKLARSKYLTNANTDDRHSPLFAFVVTKLLDSKPEVMLVYPEQIIEEVPNTAYIDSLSFRRWGWPEYSFSQLLTGNHVGSTPVWRADLHASIGYFWGHYRCAADWEFWLRIASMAGSLQLANLPISSYLFNPVGIEHGNPIASLNECIGIQSKYQTFGEYSVSDKDISRASNADVGGRTLDDMQYSGVTASHISLVVISSFNSEVLLDIVGLGAFGADSMPCVLFLDGIPRPLLPRQLIFTDFASITTRFTNLLSLSVYLHLDALVNLHSFTPYDDKSTDEANLRVVEAISSSALNRALGTRFVVTNSYSFAEFASLLAT